MNPNRPMTICLLLLILFLAVYLRFTNLASNPGWYTDEGTHLEIAKQLLNGRTRYFAINQSTLIFSRPPVFGRLLAFYAQFRGLSMMALRELTACLGVLSVFLTYITTKSLFQDRWLALSSALILALYPEAILYSRFGFSYNLLAPLLLLAIWGMDVYLKSPDHRSGRSVPHWGLFLASLAIGIGIISDLAMISLIPWLFILLIWHHWQNVVWGLVLAGLPLAIFVALNLLTNLDPFLFDINFVRSRLGGRSLLDQAWLAGLNFTLLLNQSSWFSLGFVGLWLLPNKTNRNLLLLALAFPLLVLGRTVPLTELSFYYISWILPLLAIGFGALIRFGIPYIASRLSHQPNNHWVVVAVSIALLAPLMISTMLTRDRVKNHFGTSIDRFLLNADDAIEVTDFLNQHVAGEAVVIASPGLGWRMKTNTADFQMALVAEGIDTPHLPADIPQDRFEFNPRFSNVDYVIVDNLWINWGLFHIPELSSKLKEVEQWPQVYSVGEIVVYQNPQK